MLKALVNFGFILFFHWLTTTRKRYHRTCGISSPCARGALSWGDRCEERKLRSGLVFIAALPTLHSGPCWLILLHWLSENNVPFIISHWIRHFPSWVGIRVAVLTKFWRLNVGWWFLVSLAVSFSTNYLHGQKHSLEWWLYSCSQASINCSSLKIWISPSRFLRLCLGSEYLCSLGDFFRKDDCYLF